MRFLCAFFNKCLNGFSLFVYFDKIFLQKISNVFFNKAKNALVKYNAQYLNPFFGVFDSWTIMQRVYIIYSILDICLKICI